MNNKVYYRGVSLFRFAVLIAMSVVAFTGTTNAQERIGKTRQAATLNNVQLWKENNNIVPVCWETDGYDREKQIVMAAVSNTWQEFANITFTGWGKCPTRNYCDRTTIYRNNQTAH